MEITINWDIKQLLCIGDENTVIKVEFICVASNGDLSFTRNGSVNLPLPTPETFIPYGNLTKQQVLEWVFTALGNNGDRRTKDFFESRIRSVLLDMANGNITSPSLPW